MDTTSHKHSRDRHGEDRAQEPAPKRRRSRWGDAGAGGGAAPPAQVAQAPAPAGGSAATKSARDDGSGSDTSGSRHHKHSKKSSHKHKGSHKHKSSHKHKKHSKHDKKSSKKTKKKRSKESKDDSNRPTILEEALRGLEEDSSGLSSSSQEEEVDTSKLEKWQISPKDYFAKATEFRVYLKLVRNTMFEKLSSKEAHKLFASKFVPAWNKKKLDSMYYDGIPASVLEQVKRTKHKWGFRMGAQEKFELESLRDSIAVTTNRDAKGGSRRASAAPTRPARGPARGPVGPTRPPHGHTNQDVIDRESSYKQQRADRKRFAAHQKMVMEELVPKATGRDARLEARRAKGAKIHGASRAAEDSRDGLDLPETVTFGSDTRSDLNRQLAHHRDRKARRQAQQNDRVAEIKRKEEERMAAFKRQMGLL